MWGLRISLLLVPCLMLGQISTGPINNGLGPGVVNFIDWFATTPIGCTPGTNGWCMGVNNPGGDTGYYQIWLPNASGLPITSGLPVVGTLNDNTVCGHNNISVLQLDTFSWSSPASAHIQLVNCMNSYGPNAGSDSPAGWNGHCTGTDNTTSTGWVCTWKNTPGISIGGVIYQPIHRQITTGQPSIHDASFIMSPDSGQHWCNPYTYWHHSGSPGCDSSNWDANGDAPKCDSSSNTTPCTNTAYLDSSHSSMMWNVTLGTQMPLQDFGWVPINYGNQDGSSYPTGLPNDGCDPNNYSCWMLTFDGSVARVPKICGTSANPIMDIGCWQYYTSPTANLSYRSPGGVASSWTSTFSNRTPIVNIDYYTGPYNVTQCSNIFSVEWMKDLSAYLLSSLNIGTSSTINHTCFMSAKSVQGPWTWFHQGPATTTPDVGFISTVIPTYYNLVSPGNIEVGTEADSYRPGNSVGTPQFTIWNFANGRNVFGGANYSYTDRVSYVSNAGYQFSDGHIPFSFPQNGLVWGFDFLDAGLNSGQTTWPYFIDSGNNTDVMISCDIGYGLYGNCGFMNNSHGTGMNNYGITMNQNSNQYGGHFQTSLLSGNFAFGVRNATTLQGNSSYTVAGVYRMEALTNFSRPGGLWSTGDPTSVSDNPLVELNQVNGTLQLDWGGTAASHYHYVGTVTLALNNWYNVIVSVQAATGGNCPVAHVWVGVGGALVDALAGASCVAVGSPATKTPNVAASPLVIGLNSYTASGDLGEPFIGTNATLMVYNRAFNVVDAQFWYNSMKKKAKDRGITLQ